MYKNERAPKQKKMEERAAEFGGNLKHRLLASCSIFFRQLASVDGATQSM